ncbi:MAG: biosynthetic-type acetolactate synthase large subunit, partial [Solirubrobacteraceae bacterium]
MRAVDAVMECLKAEGVDVVFGLPGGANLPTYDAFYDAGIRHVLVRHEAGGGHAAEGYAKATGKVGVAFATSGPGATNVVTPIADAMMDSVPVVFFTGQVRTELLGTDGFQEADTIGITMPIVKHSFMIQHPLELPRAIHEAFHIARTGRPGPVLIDIPVDLSRADIPYEPASGVSLPGYQPTIEGNQKQIRQAAKALAAAKRPVIYAGGGVINANAAAQLTEFATTDRFPVTCTLMGLGGFPGTHPQWLGMLGMHGTRTANYAMDAADLIVAVGARFDDRITGKLSEFAQQAKFIHIDVDPAEISKNVAAHIPIVGDARHILEKLIVEYRALEADSSRLGDWWKQIDAWREEYPLRYDDSSDSEIKPQYMIEAIYQATAGDAVIVSDVGQHQMWAAQYYHFDKPRQWINSGGLGTMGFGLPAAMGAQVGRPDAVVCAISGDGSIQMNIQELATCAQNEIPVKVFIMNNGYLGMVRQWQELFWDHRYSHVDMGEFPDFVKLAEAYGATGLRFTDKNTLVDDIRAAIATPGPVVV